MTGFPEGEPGFSLGVSACYAGIYQGELLIAGGCNFPETPAAEGGKKKFYQGIYAADASADSVFVWRKVGQLPVAAAYGVSVSTPRGIVCVGGSNENGSLSAVYRLSLSDDKQAVIVDTLPSLPCTMDNMSGSVVDYTLFVAGGNVNGKPSNGLYCLNLGNPETGWQQLPDFPGAPRVQHVWDSVKRMRHFYICGEVFPGHSMGGLQLFLLTDTVIPPLCNNGNPSLLR